MAQGRIKHKLKRSARRKAKTRLLRSRAVTGDPTSRTEPRPRAFGPVRRVSL